MVSDSPEHVSTLYSEWGENGIELKHGTYYFCIDESGRAVQENDPIIERSDKYFVLAGLFVHPSRISSLNNAYVSILEKYNVTYDKLPELKCSEIMKKKNNSFMKNDSDKKDFLCDILQIIADEPLPLFATIANKEEHLKISYSKHEYEHTYTTGYIISKALAYAKNCEQSKIQVRQDHISDKRKKEEVENDLNYSKRTGKYRNWPRGDNYDYFVDYKRVDSKCNFGVQLADVCAGAIKLTVINNDRDLIDKIEPSFKTFMHRCGHKHRDGYRFNYPFFHPALNEYEDIDESGRLRRLFKHWC